MTRRFSQILTAPRALLTALALLAALGSLSGARAGDDPASDFIRTETFRTHSRLSFHLDDGVLSSWSSDARGFELELRGIGLADLGAPLGDEARWAARYGALRDPRVASLEFAEVVGGVKVRGKWRYPQGKDAPAEPMMEAFDFRDRDRSRLVIDFWVKEGPTVAEVEAVRSASRKIASVKHRDDVEKARIARRLAREKARALAEDPKLFCSTPLSDRTDVFLSFLPIHEPVQFKRWFSTATPDSDFAYYEPQGNEPDAKYVRLALKLYKDGKFALANRTIDFFDQECKESGFRSEMRFLRANALLKLKLQDEGMQLLRELQREKKASPINLHASTFLALKELEAKNYLGALEAFMGLAEKQSESRLAWIFHLGIAECARALRQTDRAAHEYQWVAENAPDGASQSEGALRIGDLYMDRRQYDQALAAYAQAIRSFPKESKNFAVVHINRADSLFGLGQFDRANEAYREFLKQYPTHPAGWRATYRLGELAARDPGQSRETPSALNWYLETINRYPFSPGATLARLQLVPCGEHGGFTPESADKFFAAPNGEAERFEGGGEVMMDRFKDFRALARVRSLMTFGKQEQAVATAVKELARVPQAEARRWLSHLLSFNFRRSILEMLTAGQELGALTFYQNNADTVPLTTGDVDPDYLLKLSRAASDRGLGKLGRDINTVFEKAYKIRQENTREIASDAVSTDPDIKQASSERAFTDAKALWIADGMKSSDEVRARLGRVAPESRFSFEREVILGLMDEIGKQDVAALRHAAQAQLLGPNGGPDAARINAWVAALQARVGDANAALTSYRALETQTGEGAGVTALLGVPPVPSREALIRLESEILEKQTRWGEAAANYARAVDNGLGGAEARYGYARALLKAGGAANRDNALATLEKIVAEADADDAKAAAQAVAAKKAADSGAKPAEGAQANKPTEKKSAREIASAAAQASNTQFWRKLASETLADEKAKQNAKEGMKP